MNLERNPNCHIDEHYIFLSPCASLEQLFNLSVSVSLIYGFWTLKQKHLEYMHQIIIYVYRHTSEAVHYMLKPPLCKLSLHISVSS